MVPRGKAYAQDLFLIRLCQRYYEQGSGNAIPQNSTRARWNTEGDGSFGKVSRKKGKRFGKVQRIESSLMVL